MEQINDSNIGDREAASIQLPAEFAVAVSQAWGELDLDPTLSGNPAMSPSGQGCCACY